MLPSTADEIAYREHVESVRKDIECFFGVLKGRFRILKLPLLYRGIHKLDSIFQTCCALHNMLHSYDGLSLLEKDCDWGGKDGDLDPWVNLPEGEETLDDNARFNLDAFETDFADLQRKLVVNLAAMKKKGTVGWRRS